VSSHEVKSRANLSRPVVVAAQWVNQHEIMLGFEAAQESILTWSLEPAWLIRRFSPLSRRQWSGRFGLPGLPFPCLL